MAEADDLEGRIRDFRARLQTADEDTRGTGFRLEDAAGAIRHARDALSEGTSDLTRARAVRDGSVCAVPWGVCPDHGNTLRSSGGRCWCTELACARSWGYDRLGSACGEPLTHNVTDAHGGSFLACRAHAMDADERLEGGTVTAL
ncbi:hypothetical protein [Streptomyces sp. NPDC001927]